MRPLALALRAWRKPPSGTYERRCPVSFERNSIWGLNYLDTRAQALQSEDVLDTAALDKYRFLRNAYLRARRYQLYDGKPPPELEEE